MTDEELAQIAKWQSTSEGKADLALHALMMTADDLQEAACTREGFTLIRKSRANLIKARDILDHLIASTSMFHAEAAE